MHEQIIQFEKMITADSSKKILYIGENVLGTTSRHRRRLLDEIYRTKSVVVDFNSFLPKWRLFKSLFWRFQPLIRLRAFERELTKQITGVKFDLVWIDKGFFVKSEMISSLRQCSEKLVFFTPDCFFYQNSSPAIRRQLFLFDLVITTKSFEINQFAKYVFPSKLMLVNQGYTNGEIPCFQEERMFDVLFIGKYEAHRQKVVIHLANAGIRIAVGGAGWRKKKRNFDGSYVTFLGDDFRGSRYQDLISNSKVCLGLLSKNFPELHTTRTFEIPYFGSVLATERNKETQEFFDEHQVLFYDNLEELTDKIKNILRNGSWLEIGKEGQQKVLSSNYSWEDQIVNAIKRLQEV